MVERVQEGYEAVRWDDTAGAYVDDFGIVPTIELTDMERRAVLYMERARPDVAQFDDDHDPIGLQLRHQLVSKGAIFVEWGRMCTTTAGRCAAGVYG